MMEKRRNKNKRRPPAVGATFLLHPTNPPSPTTRSLLARIERGRSGSEDIKKYSSWRADLQQLLRLEFAFRAFITTSLLSLDSDHPMDDLR